MIGNDLWQLIRDTAATLTAAGVIIALVLRPIVRRVLREAREWARTIARETHATTTQVTRNGGDAPTVADTVARIEAQLLAVDAKVDTLNGSYQGHLADTAEMIDLFQANKTAARALLEHQGARRWTRALKR